jgi:predicted N-acyltransferase
VREPVLPERYVDRIAARERQKRHLPEGQSLSRRLEYDAASLHTVETITEVAEDEWDALVGDDEFYASHAWLRSIEQEPDMEARYLLARSGSGELVGALPTYFWDGGGPAATTSHYDPFAVFCEGLPAKRRDAWLPQLLLGTRAGYSNAVLVDRKLPPEERAETLRGLVDAALELADEREVGTAAMMYLTPEKVAEAAPAFVGRARALRSSAAVSIGIEWESFDGYLESLSGKRRGTVRRELRLFEQSGLTVSVERLGACIDRASELLAAVDEKYDTGATAEEERAYLAAQAELLDDRSVLFAARSGEEIVGVCLLYRFRDALYGRVVGFDYDKLGDDRVYANLAFYEPIRYAIDEGLRRVHFGTGSWEAKLLRGGELTPLWSLVRPPEDLADDVERALDEWNDTNHRWWVDNVARLKAELPDETWIGPGRATAPR